MPKEIEPERLLYGPTRRFLHVAFVDRLRDQTAVGELQIYAADTSVAQSSDAGHWTRPDVAALVLGRGQYVPHWKADLHTFEVKTAAGISEVSVHEANAHGRFGHYAWLVFQTDQWTGEQGSGQHGRIRKLAAHLGIGLIHFCDSETPRDWTIELWPRRTGTDDHTADVFVRQRFPSETRAQIASHLSGLGWVGDS